MVETPHAPGKKRAKLLRIVLFVLPPILLFMVLIEVAWAWRGHVMLAEVTREATHFSARSPLSPASPTIPDSAVLTYISQSGAGGLPVDFTGDDPNATLIITRFEIDTGYPCDARLPGNPPCNDFCSNPPCDCSAPDKREPAYPSDDRIILPPPMGGSYGEGIIISDSLRAVYGLGAPAHTTRISDDLWRQYREENDVFNCRFLSEHPTESPTGLYVLGVELFYDQPQLLGVPPISNKLSDPVTLYSRTLMRLPAARRR